MVGFWALLAVGLSVLFGCLVFLFWGLLSVGCFGFEFWALGLLGILAASISGPFGPVSYPAQLRSCLLYTSDAADE